MASPTLTAEAVVVSAAQDVGSSARVADGRPAPLHIPSLDGLRAVSFFIVFLAHSSLGPRFIPIPGGFGVTVFFFLSGFLITTLMRIEREKTGSVNIPHFYLRRVLRILPPFYLILGLAIGLTLTGWLPPGMQPSAIAAQVLHVSNYWFIYHGAEGAPAGTVPYWSLAVEEHFYLVFPLLYLTLNRYLSTRAQARVLWGLCALVCLWRCVLVFGLGVTEDRTYMGSDTRFDSILFGSAMALGINPVLDRTPGREGVWKWGLVPAALLLLLFTFTYRMTWFRETIRYSVQGIALTPIFIAAIRYPTWLPFRFLNAGVVAFVGVLSYTLYLVHQITLVTLEYNWPLLDAATSSAIALLLAFGIAVVVHYAIEKPSAKLRKQLSRGAARPARVVS